MNEYIVGFSKAHDERALPQLTRNPRESRERMSGLCALAATVLPAFTPYPTLRIAQNCPVAFT